MKNVKKIIKKYRLLLLGIIILIIGNNCFINNFASSILVLIGLWIIIYNIISKVENSLNIKD
jgi:hypothetical protein